MASITACIPLFNGERYIRNSMRSVMLQTRQPDEIVVVDDGSTDAGPEIVEEYAKNDYRIRLVRKDNGGQSSARNLGVKHSTGTFLAFLDQDDWWYPKHLEMLEAAALSYSGPGRLGWIYSDLDEYDGSGRLFVRRFLTVLGSEHPKSSIYACLAQNMFVLPSASLILREAFEAVGGFDERLRGFEDDDLFLRLFVGGYANVFLPEPLSAWRIHGGSSSHTAHMTDSALIYLQKLCEAFPNEVQVRRYFVRDLIAPRFLRHAIGSYSVGAEINDRAMIASSLRLMDGVAKRLPVRRRVLLRSLRPFFQLRLVQCLAAAPALRGVAAGWLRRARVL